MNAFLALPLAVVLSVPVPTYAADFDQCKHFFVNGFIPKITKPPGQLKALCFDSFAVLYSGESKTPVYVVERLNKAQMVDAKGEKRTNRFYEEARVPSAGRATLADYKGQDAEDGKQTYDKGHMAPAGDMPDAQSMAQSFSLANMVPHAAKNNRGTWRVNVEGATKKYAMRASGDVYVFTAPGHHFMVQVLGPNKVWIPSYLYKLVYDANTGRSWAHVVDNTDAAKAGKPITYEELVQKTGNQFLPTK